MIDEEQEKTLFVGVSGYLEKKFDEAEAREIIEQAFDEIEEEYIDSDEYDEIVIVSGLINRGIPKIAYEVADERDYKTMGVVPLMFDKQGFEEYPVDEIMWVGENFGDESETFVGMIDVFVKVGGGEQTQKELELAEADDISVLDFDLEELE